MRKDSKREISDIEDEIIELNHEQSEKMKNRKHKN